ncbi:hypothetical protein Hanom_Chr05g00395171 [Helianthus anomalus]
MNVSRTHYRMFMNIVAQTRHLFMFVHLTNRTEFLVHVPSLIKRTHVNEFPVKRFTNCSLNILFIYSPNLRHNYHN